MLKNSLKIIKLGHCVLSDVTYKFAPLALERFFIYDCAHDKEKNKDLSKI